MFWPPTTAPMPPDCTHPWIAPMAPIQTPADIRAKAYQMARAEFPDGCDRMLVMEAADEIYEYLLRGAKPSRV